MNALIIGLFTGVLVGASSVGSGSLVTPLLLLFTSVPAGAAVGTSLALASGTKLLGYLAHRRMGQVDHRLGFWLVLGAVPGTVAAGLVLGAIQRVELPASSLRHAAGFFLMLLAVLIWLGANSMWPRQASAHQSGDKSPHSKIAIGAVIAFVVTLTSVGSGGLVIMLLLWWRPNVPVCRLVGTTIFYGLVATLLGASAHLALSNVDARLLLQLAAGTVPGVLLGARLSRIIPERYAQTGIAGLNMLLGLRLALAG